MGKLFWKFFFIFWLAQIVTALGVGLVIWTLRPQIFAPPMHAELSEHSSLPPAESRYEMSLPPPEMPNNILLHRQDSRFPPLLPILAGIVVSLIFAALLAWYFARPIRNLRTAFEAVANGKLETRIGMKMDGRKDELADLGHDFDRMASRLQSLMDAQRRLLHDVSHELRSPLARLQAATDLMQQQPERAAEFIIRIERDTGRIDTLVGELLTLARLDSGMAERMEEVVDIRELIEHIAHDASFEAESKQCTVDISLPNHIAIKGNHELLFRALENVVRNAVLHSPAGKRIAITVTRDATKQWLISVADEGLGVLPSELESIFAPFFRSQSGSGSNGYGLGLAITQRIVQAHDGTVSATNRAEGGLSVVISLPAAD